MRNILLILVLVLFAGVCNAQTIFEENFNYTAGTLLNANGWTPSGSPPSTVNQLLVTAPGLTFAGYPPALGNATTLANTGEDVYRTFTAQTSGSVYASFLLNVQTASSIGDYFFALSASTAQTNYYARTHIKSSGSGFLIGISKNNELVGGYEYGTTVRSFNITYLVVIKHTFNTGNDTDDIERVFVFTGIPPATEPSTSEIGPYLQTGKPDPADLGMITLRQGGTVSGGVLTNPGPELKLDGIRILKSWGALLTSVKNEFSTIPTTFDLSQNYPNPFNPSTVIKYQIPQNTFVNINIYDVLGNQIRNLVREEKAAGSYELKFDASNMPSGVYFYSIQAGAFSQTKKMILMK